MSDDSPTLSPGRVAFNIVMGVDHDSDDFDFQPPRTQETWEQAVREAAKLLRNE